MAGLITVYYISFAMIVFYLKISFYLFCLSIPWSPMIIVISAFFYHENVDSFVNYGWLAGGFLNGLICGALHKNSKRRDGES
jgi:hypothetical protein